MSHSEASLRAERSDSERQRTISQRARRASGLAVRSDSDERSIMVTKAIVWGLSIPWVLMLQPGAPQTDWASHMRFHRAIQLISSQQIVQTQEDAIDFRLAFPFDFYSPIALTTSFTKGYSRLLEAPFVPHPLPPQIVPRAGPAFLN